VSYTAGEVDYLLHRLGWSWQAPAAVDALPSQPLYWGRQASHKSLPASAATLCDDGAARAVWDSASRFRKGAPPEDCFPAP
jgi:hypothetical protein